MSPKDNDPKPYGPVRYGPKSPEWAEKRKDIEKTQAWQKIRDDKFILAIQKEQKRKGKPMTYEQAKRELEKQQHISEREILWQSHRDVLTEGCPLEKQKRGMQVKFTKDMAVRKETNEQRLERENKELREMVESLTESVQELTAQLRQARRDNQK